MQFTYQRWRAGVAFQATVENIRDFVWEIAWVSGLPKGLGERGFEMGEGELSPFFASIFLLFLGNAWYSVSENYITEICER